MASWACVLEPHTRAVRLSCQAVSQNGKNYQHDGLANGWRFLTFHVGRHTVRPNGGRILRTAGWSVAY
jgi:hypothetical protein